MKVRRRTVPYDMMSAESKGRRISVMACGHRIVLSTNTGADGSLRRGASHSLTFDEMFALIERFRPSKKPTIQTKNRRTKTHQSSPSIIPMRSL